MVKHTHNKFTSTGRKKKTTAKRICHCKPNCNKKLTKKTRKGHYKRLTEEEMEHRVSSETCSQISSADSIYVRSGKKDEESDSSMDEGGSVQSNALVEKMMSISGQYSI